MMNIVCSLVSWSSIDAVELKVSLHNIFVSVDHIVLVYSIVHTADDN